MTESVLRPWVVVGPHGVQYLGVNDGEDEAWTFALGYPNKAEIEEKKAQGWYAAPATVTWNKPDGKPADDRKVS